MRVYRYVCICVYTYVYVYIYIYLYTHTHAHAASDTTAVFENLGSYILRIIEASTVD